MRPQGCKHTIVDDKAAKVAGFFNDLSGCPLAHTLEVLGNRGMLLTVPSVMYGLFRYIYLIYHRKKGQDPTITLFYDLPTICNLIIWTIISFLVVNYGSQLHLFR